MGIRARLFAVALTAGTIGVSPATAGTPDGGLYENDFSSKEQYREIRQVGGGKACTESYLPDKGLMRVEVVGEAHCQYRPPVMQEGGVPDQRWTVAGQISDEIARGKRIRAFMTSQVRAGLGGFYQLRIHPKSEAWIHTRRAPDEGVETLNGDRLDAVRPVGAFNRMFLRATGDTFRAEVNDAGTDFPYQDSDPVVGRGVRFGIGSKLDRPDPVVGYFKLLRVGPPR